ncbi:MAG: hypothetical protein JO326_09545 [Acetobacteraceae bacterium]|nr:hypothetical protein [Acetobacteraceae bacterium]
MSIDTYWTIVPLIGSVLFGAATVYLFATEGRARIRYIKSAGPDERTEADVERTATDVRAERLRTLEESVHVERERREALEKRVLAVKREVERLARAESLPPASNEQVSERLAPASVPGVAVDQPERKAVSVMFADVHMPAGRVLAPEDAAEILEPATAAMMEGVRQFGGIVARVHGDGVMALFDAPTSRSDHAERACLAAIQILRRATQAADANLAVRIGIDSGAVLSQRDQNDAPLDPNVLGAPAQIAASLEQLAAPNTAVISKQTLRLAGKAVRGRALGKLTLNGVAEPVEGYELEAAG